MATLSGIITPSNVLTATSTATLTNKTWNSNAIGTAYGGTGLTTLGTAGQVLTVNSGATALEFAAPAGGSLLRTTVFTSSGTWTKGTGTNFIKVRGVGGGGGGAGGSGGFAGGGGAGGYFEVFQSSSALSTATVTIGSGGAAGSASTGGTGGNTLFGSIGRGNGGSGGGSGKVYFLLGDHERLRPDERPSAGDESHPFLES